MAIGGSRPTTCSLACWSMSAVQAKIPRALVLKELTLSWHKNKRRYNVRSAIGDVPCLPGDEIERQRAQRTREQQQPSADAYVQWGHGEMADKTVPLVLLECKYRVQTENVNRNTRKVGALYGELCRKFNSSRTFLEGEGRICRRHEVVVFNAAAVEDMRDALESWCIGEGRSVFNVVDTEKLASSGLIGIEVTS